MRKSAEFDPARLRHMLDASEAAQRFVAGRSREALEDDELLAFGLARAVEIIGEAASQITNDLQAANPQVNWGKIIGMRHRLAHAYFQINYDVLWNSVIDDIPPLIAQLKSILARLDDA